MNNNTLEHLLVEMVNTHNYSLDPACESIAKEVLQECNWEFSLISIEGLYYLKLTASAYAKCIVYNVNSILTQLLICPELNPHKKLSYFTNDGYMYSYCEVLTTREKAGLIYPIEEVYFKVNKSNSTTNVVFVSSKPICPDLNVIFSH
jgi:hypothetical protein